MSTDFHKKDILLVDFITIKAKIIFYYKKWYRSIWLLWGDISIHPKVFDIVSTCKKLWYIEINVITNWMVFDNYTFAEKLVVSGVNRINISIHSHKKEIEDDLTMVPWWLLRKLKAIDNFNILYSKGLLKSPLSINIVLNKKNYVDLLETIIYFFSVKKIADIRINFIWLDNNIKKYWDELKISYTDIIPSIKKVMYYSIKYWVRVTFDEIPNCIFYKLFPWETENLIKKFSSSSFDYIDLVEELSLWDKSHESTYLRTERDTNLYKTKFDWCKQCLYFNTCKWVWKSYVDIYGENEFQAVTSEKYTKNSLSLIKTL